MTNDLIYEISKQVYQELYELEKWVDHETFTKRFVFAYRDLYDGFMALYEQDYLHYDDIMRLEHTFYLVRYKQGESAIDQAMFNVERLLWTVIELNCDIEEAL